MRHAAALRRSARDTNESSLGSAVCLLNFINAFRNLPCPNPMKTSFVCTRYYFTFSIAPSRSSLYIYTNVAALNTIYASCFLSLDASQFSHTLVLGRHRMHDAMEAFGPPLIQFRFVTTHPTSLNSLPSLHRLFFDRPLHSSDYHPLPPRVYPSVNALTCI